MYHASMQGDVLEGGATKYVLATVAILVIALGVSGIVLGEADDSPGLQALGAVLVIGTLAATVRTVLRSRSQSAASAKHR